MPGQTRERNVKGCLVAAMIWVVILGLLAVATKFLILPQFKKTLVDKTGSASRYKNEITVAADSFSGYCILRSDVLREDLAGQGVKLTIKDDGANYEARMNALLNQEIQMAVFTIDSFVLTASRIGTFPGTIVMIIDETRGADAMVSYQDAVQDIQDLDDVSARIVLTRNSPSEFLARTIIAHFNLPNLPAQCWVEASGASDVFQRFQKAPKTERRAYVMWEPYVSKSLALPGAHLLLDSSKLKGYIVDVLVVERGFLSDHSDLVRALLESYFRAQYSYAQKQGGLSDLVKEDATLTGSEALNPGQADKLVQGIVWKTTIENYAHFGLLSEAEASGFQYTEDMILNITDVLVKTGAIQADPFAGKANSLFYDQTLRDMQSANFHPGKRVNVIDGLGPTPGDLGQVRADEPLRALSEAEWQSLLPVGQLKVAPIAFARGTAGINIQSERDLDELCRKLPSWPRYYLLVMGHARAEGDPQANLKLAQERAMAVTNYLFSKGVPRERVKAQAAPPSGTEGSSQSVSFELRQAPY